ncbi:hypothetical protein JJB98_09735 [Bradyrhizobium diazoefficiens]|nr:hypothetical protein [Bradyrhizobium diazoefficiens]QQO20175.1 hypothetical protein JJB98_09735 [Bradyrhizobium diazoefficiens]
MKRSHGRYSCKEDGSRTGNAPPEDDGGGVLDDESNRDEVLEAKRPANYKSVIAGSFSSDFSLKTACTRERLRCRNMMNGTCRSATMTLSLKFITSAKAP